MSEFKTFADQINACFKQLQKGRDLFVSSASGEELYAAYLAAFPDGSNPLFRERTEHECNNCRGFIKNFDRLSSGSRGNPAEDAAQVRQRAAPGCGPENNGIQSQKHAGERVTQENGSQALPAGRI